MTLAHQLFPFYIISAYALLIYKPYFVTWLSYAPSNILGFPKQMQHEYLELTTSIVLE